MGDKMSKRVIGAVFCLFVGLQLHAQLKFEEKRPLFLLENGTVITTPEEGMWSVATGWKNDWMTGWVHANPAAIEVFNEWTILKGEMQLPEGMLLLRDAYREVKPGLIRCIRRFEWRGEKELSPLTLSLSVYA